MGFEVDFLAVGEGERSGDAICFRFGNLYGTRDEQTVCVIDGGSKDSGERLVEHIRTHYSTNKVDIVFCTHPDSDHASGLTVVLESLECCMLVMHRPWEHSEDICHLFDDPKITPDKLAGRMERNLYAAHELEKLATAKHITIVEPFAGVTGYNGQLLILGPTKDYYQSLLANFRDMPELAEDTGVYNAIKSFVSDAVTWIGESMHIETLVDPVADATSAENRSSMILLLRLEGESLLLTGDAGTESLQKAIDFAASKEISLANLRLFQVPHHGSKRNIGPTILNQLKAKAAYVSAAKEGAPKHPSKKVTNALLRRGSGVYSTQGKGLCHFSDNSGRAGWGNAVPVQFFDQVEED